MRSSGMILVLASAACLAATAQTSDIRGAYQASIEGEHLRLVVTEEPQGAYAFELYDKTAEDVVFDSPPSRDRAYAQVSGGGTVRLRFNSEGCRVEDAYGSRYLFKRSGPLGDIPGGYSAVGQAEGPVVLQVEPVQGGYRFRLQRWGLGMRARGAKQASDVYELESEWGEAFRLEFVPEGCVLRMEGAAALLLEKAASGSLHAFIPAEAGWVKTLPDFSMAGDAASAFRTIHRSGLPRSWHARAASLAVARRKELDFEGIPIHSLSPDGTKILAAYQPSVLVFDTRYGTLFERFSRKAGLDDPQSVSWSPDGGRIVFTDNYFFFMREPDLHLIDLGARSLETLTEDGSEEALPHDPDAAAVPLIDITPVWLPDSRTILFQRFDPRIGGVGRFYLVSTETGVVTPASEPQTRVPNIVNLRVDYPSGAVCYTYFSERKSDGNGGIWRLEPGQRRPVQLLSSVGRGWEYTVLKEIAFSGGIALIYHPDAGGSPAQQKMRFALLDLDSLAVTELAAPNGDQFLNATFSPDGSKILFTYRDQQGQRTCLAVREVAGGPENVLLDSEDPSLGFLPLRGGLDVLGLDWAANDSVLVLEEMGKKALLLELQTR